MDGPGHMPLSQDAALVIALAGTAMPFSHSGEDEAERWLRALRLHGQVGSALQALGIGEAPLMTGGGGTDDVPSGAPPLGGGAVVQVTRSAENFARGRDAEAVSTIDLLFAVLELYDRLFDRALYLRGSSREELVEKMIAMESRASSNSV